MRVCLDGGDTPHGSARPGLSSASMQCPVLHMAGTERGIERVVQNRQSAWTNTSLEDTRLDIYSYTFRMVMIFAFANSDF